MNADNPAAIQNVVLQRDDLQNGLLSTCREVSRATAVSNMFLPVKLIEVLNVFLHVHNLNWVVFGYFSSYSNKTQLAFTCLYFCQRQPESDFFLYIHQVVILQFFFFLFFLARNECILALIGVVIFIFII